MRVAYTASWKSASGPNVKASLDILKRAHLFIPSELIRARKKVLIPYIVVSRSYLACVAR